MKFASGVSASKMCEEKALVDVIPGSDPRHKLTWTKLNVILIIVIFLLLLTLVLVFFLFPRSINVSYGGIKSVVVSFDQDKRCVFLNITNVLDISNHNYHKMDVTNIMTHVIFSGQLIGKIDINSSVNIAPRSQQQIDYTVPTMLGDDMSYIYDYCTLPTIRTHKIGVMMEILLTASYFGYVEQHFQSTYEYLDCGVNTTLHHSIPDFTSSN